MVSSVTRSSRLRSVRRHRHSLYRGHTSPTVRSAGKHIPRKRLCRCCSSEALDAIGVRGSSGSVFASVRPFLGLSLDWDDLTKWQPQQRRSSIQLLPRYSHQPLSRPLRTQPGSRTLTQLASFQQLPRLHQGGSTCAFHLLQSSTQTKWYLRAWVPIINILLLRSRRRKRPSPYPDGHTYLSFE